MVNGDFFFTIMAYSLDHVWKNPSNPNMHSLLKLWLLIQIIWKKKSSLRCLVNQLNGLIIKSFSLLGILMI